MSDHDTDVEFFLANPLASRSGTIPAEKVSLSPTGSISIPAWGSTRVGVSVKVPKKTGSGEYLGILRCRQVPHLSVLLQVDVL